MQCAQRPYSIIILARDFTQRLGNFSNEAKRKADDLRSDGRAAPIIPFLHGQAFDPETIEAMGKAFVTTREALGLSDHTAAMTNLVAEKIIELAERGLKTPTALFLAAIKEFKADPQ